jgi:hypothetical protein
LAAEYTIIDFLWQQIFFISTFFRQFKAIWRFSEALDYPKCLLPLVFNLPCLPSDLSTVALCEGGSPSWRTKDGRRIWAGIFSTAPKNNIKNKIKMI